LGIERWYVAQVIKGLTFEEKQTMVRMITDEFIMNMSMQDRKEMIKIVLPGIIDTLMSGMTMNDRKELIETIMPLIIAQIGSTKMTAHEKKEPKSHTMEGN
jgi:hypothetical protein